MDVTNKADILEAVKTIETREGKLHILVNKYVVLNTYHFQTGRELMHSP